MQNAISIKPDILKKAEQALLLTHFKSVEDLITSLIEEKMNELERQPGDSIYRVRGILKSKKGGTALFMQDKQIC